MSEPNWTRARHAVLREVAAGQMSVYIGMQWNLIRRPNDWLTAGEKRVATALKRYITHQPTDWGGGQTGALLTDEGRVLLASWNAAHPDEETPNA